MVQPMLIRLTNKVQTLHKELKQLKTEKDVITLGVMPTQPFKDIEKFLSLKRRNSLESLTLILYGVKYELTN